MSAFEELGLVKSRDFGDGRARFTIVKDDNHDLLFDVSTGQVIEFHDAELERLKKRIAKRLGYSLESHCLELHGRPADAETRTG
ncbi:MAG: transcriptional repressor [Pseudomonadota bacterium]